jgi:transposase-like protein
MSFASWKERKPIASALRAVYRAETAETGLAALDAFEAGHWGKRHPAIAQSWRRHWDQVIPFFTFPQGVRRIIYTTNAIEALNSKLRRAVRTRGHLPGDDAAMKLLYLRPQQGGRGMETAAARVVGGKNPVRRDLRRTVRHLMTITGPAHKITDSPIRRITPWPRAS